MRGGIPPDANSISDPRLTLKAGRGGGHGDIAGETADVRCDRTSEARPLTAVCSAGSGPEYPQILIWGMGGAAAVLPRATAARRAGAGRRATTPTGVLPFSMLVRVETQVPRGEGMGGEGLALAGAGCCWRCECRRAVLIIR